MGEAKRRRESTNALAHTGKPASRPPAPEASQSVEHPAAELDPRILAVEKFDAMARARNRLRNIAKGANQWAGLPLDIEGEELVVHPSYPWHYIFDAKRVRREAAHKVGSVNVRNMIWSERFRCYVAICDDNNGKATAIPMKGSGNSVDAELRTMGCSVAWGIEQESKALQLLGTLIKHHAFKYYLMTGQFLESSPRSGVTYMFRKLRPTVAFKERRGTMRILTCLCMHPIGYYKDSWAGAMCPTDDVIAHLVMMRGDEHRYWKYANHIPPGRPTAGI